jgi:SAM-dependent methyltransferase/acyl carrier protein
MDEWVEATVARLRALGGRRVLEVGCGTGLLLRRLAPGSERYRGTDFSRAALAAAGRAAAGGAIDQAAPAAPAPERLPAYADGVEPGTGACATLPAVELELRRADDWSGIERGEFDLVVLNSVVQYFPDADYLLRVLTAAVEAAGPDGTVFVGDVRNLELLEAFHVSLALAGAAGETAVAALHQQARRSLAADEELAIAPAFFHDLARRLPAIRQVEVLLKRGRHHNEMTRFRYDVVLRLGERCGPDPAAVTAGNGRWAAAAGTREGPGRAVQASSVAAGAASPAARPTLSRVGIAWEDQAHGAGGARAELERLLAAGGAASCTAIGGIPNARLAMEKAVLDLLARPRPGIETVADLRRAIGERLQGQAGDARAAADPEEIWELAARHGFVADLTPAAGGFRFDAALRRSDAPRSPAAAAPGGTDGAAWVNDPLRRRLARRLVPELRRFLKAELPEHMVPAAFVLLDGLPLSAHGKVDRQALPAPEAERPEDAGAYAEPGGPLEKEIAAIWAEVLGLPRVGVNDDFFALGGHSLMATRVVSRLRDAFGVEVPLRATFQARTVAELAAVVERLQVEQADPAALADLLAEVGSLSDEAIQGLLAEGDGADGRGGSH